MPLLWLRVAVGCYAVGLIYALVALTRTSDLLGRVALHASYLGMVFQLVSLSEAVQTSGQLTIASIHNSISLLAFIIMAFFMLAYAIYRTTSPGIIVFPVVFLLTFVAATGQQPILVTSARARTGWLLLHIALIFTGYAALILSFGASLLYLVQERSLKAKKSREIFSRLPALEIIDEIGYRSLLIGFPFMTLGLIAGIVVAETTYGRVDFLDPKVTLSVLMWAAYMIMLYMRWNSGWRGRRAAYLAAGTFAAAVIAWAANYFSSIHKFTSS
jgi:ABC-type uncharacterized transport system permease subunit